jgi:hypothetical protein
MYQAVQEAISRATTIPPSDELPPAEFRSRAFQVCDLHMCCSFLGVLFFPFWQELCFMQKWQYVLN